VKAGDGARCCRRAVLALVLAGLPPACKEGMCPRLQSCTQCSRAARRRRGHASCCGEPRQRDIESALNRVDVGPEPFLEAREPLVVSESPRLGRVPVSGVRGFSVVGSAGRRELHGRSSHAKDSRRRSKRVSDRVGAVREVCSNWKRLRFGATVKAALGGPRDKRGAVGEEAMRKHRSLQSKGIRWP
jgi:hypothetical protein